MRTAGYRWGTGHRLRVAIASQLWPVIWPSPFPATFGIHRGPEAPSRLELQVIPPAGGEGDAPVPSFQVSPPVLEWPEAEALDGRGAAVDDPPAWRIEEDVIAGSTTVHVHDGGEAIVPDGRRLYAAETLRMTAWDRDPARAELDANVVYRWQEREPGGDGGLLPIEIRAVSTQTSTATDFDLAVRLEVDLDGRALLRARLARDHPARARLSRLVPMDVRHLSAKAERFTESVIREMNRLAVAQGAVSLAQGFPDFPCPPELKRAVAEAVDADLNQYAITWGAKPLRDAIAVATARHFPAVGDRSGDARSPSPAAPPRR